jgi:shikimate dehydrogenase
MTDRYVVAGNPVAHSRSPMIHARFAVQTGQDMEYRRLLVPLGGFAAAARDFFAGGGKGMNVTVPFKLDAFALADRLSSRAAEAGAVNTLWLAADGQLHGDNTDGAGLVRDLLHNLGWRIAGARVLLLGAGGAARGAVGPLLEQVPAELVIANRTADKARALAGRFASAGPVRGCGFDALQGRFDLVINGTSASLQGDVPPLADGLLAPAACYDMAYASGRTAFLARAATAGASRLADGLGMLVEQAAESFYIWRGVRPETGSLIEELRAAVVIRPARDEQDLQRVAGLFRDYQQWLGEDLCFQGFERELATLPGSYAPPTGALLLAESAGEAIGCVAMRMIEPGVCEMKRLYVRPGRRGARLGHALARAAIQAARDAGHATMRLDTLVRLKEAMALYRSLGFRERAPYYDNPLGNVVYWELDLHQGAASEGETA